MADPAREAGMREMSRKFRDMGGLVYADAERVKKSNEALKQFNRSLDLSRRSIRIPSGWCVLR